MKHDEYLRKITSKEEIEPGLLSELEADFPPGMHDRIMDSIKIENKRRLRFAKYKIFAPVAAAAIVIAVSLSSISGLVNKGNEAKNNLTAKNSTSAQSNNITSKEKATDASVNNKTVTQAGSTANANSQVKNNSAASAKKSSTQKSPTNNSNKNTVSHSTKYQNSIDENTVVDGSTIDDVIIDSDTPYSGLIAQTSVADYELTIYRDEVEILSFINQKCELVDKYNNYYKIRKEDFNILSDMISKKTDSCKLVQTNKDRTSSKSNYLLVKLIVK